MEIKRRRRRSKLLKKIMFSDKYGLTKAVLEGRKTQTRRICKHQFWSFSERVDANSNHYFPGIKMPFKEGEELAVAQSYFDCGYTTNARPVEIMTDHVVQFGNGSAGWNNKMFVKADLMPHRIKITNVRVEHLQDISDEDCFKEGIRTGGYKPQYYTANGLRFHYSSPQDAFAHLINKIYGKGTWESNPWVFVYEFELIK